MARLLVPLAASLLIALPPVASGLDSGAELRGQADALRARDAAVSAQGHAVLLELYALESRLARARGELARLQEQVAGFRRERVLAHRRLEIARRTLAAAQQQLADQLRLLYEEGDTDPLAVLLGATSLDEAITSLDGLRRAASQSRRIMGQATSARREIADLTRTLAIREQKVRLLTVTAAATGASLESAVAERTAYVARLRTEQRLNAAEIVSLETRARAIEANAQALSARDSAAASVASFAAAPVRIAPQLVPEADASAPAPAASGQTLTVSSTGYALTGTTATGVPVGWGIVAVDPSVIPLGTRMTIPGYGEGVAADLGSAVRGATIDLWFPTLEQAQEWGRRTIAITLH